MKWLSSPGTITLADDTVHMWFILLDAGDDTYAICKNVLNAEELNRAQRYRFEAPRRRFVLTRALLRLLAGIYIQSSPPHIRFTHNQWGKPGINTTAGQRLEFNVSHSYDIALLAFSRNRPLGIDVECMHAIPNVQNLVKEFFSEYEYLQFKELPQDQQLKAFFMTWTRKEAYIKGTGRGFSQPFRSFDVSIHPAVPAVLLNDHTDPTAVASWKLMDISTLRNYAASAAIGEYHHQTCEVKGYRLAMSRDYETLI
ncbi:MAG: 4'-phosphopantetheinyl transferase superfamily protein, partial [Anaerolineae bacterium]|nr:4'-phosphopantetheinyl transferase superfamily protein [Anaerolineae bacterium]